MKVDHNGLYVKDLKKVGEFYEKYFNGTVSEPAYHNNPKKILLLILLLLNQGQNLKLCINRIFLK